MNITDDNQLFSNVSHWIGKTVRKITLKPFSIQKLEFNAVALHPGLYNLNSFEILQTDNDANLDIGMPNDEAIIRVLNSGVDLYERDCFTEAELLAI